MKESIPYQVYINIMWKLSYINVYGKDTKELMKKDSKVHRISYIIMWSIYNFTRSISMSLWCSFLWGISLVGKTHYNYVSESQVQALYSPPIYLHTSYSLVGGALYVG